MKKLIKVLKEKNRNDLIKKIKAVGSDELQSKLLKFFKSNPYPKDDKVHAFAKQLGIEPDDLETAIYRLLTDFVKGVGRHINIPDSKFDPKQLAMGIKVEHEHTDNPAIAKEISKDHLSEISGLDGKPGYYTLLEKMEKGAEVK